MERRKKLKRKSLCMTPICSKILKAGRNLCPLERQQIVSVHSIPQTYMPPKGQLPVWAVLGRFGKEKAEKGRFGKFWEDLGMFGNKRARKGMFRHVWASLAVRWVVLVLCRKPVPSMLVLCNSRVKAQNLPSGGRERKGVTKRQPPVQQ